MDHCVPFALHFQTWIYKHHIGEILVCHNVIFDKFHVWQINAPWLEVHFQRFLHICNTVLDLLKDYFIDGQHSADFFFEKMTTGGGKKATLITPQGWIFWTMIFYNLKKFTSRSIQWEVKVNFEFTRSWLCFSNTAIFWQMSWNYRFCPFTTISE